MIFLEIKTRTRTYLVNADKINNITVEPENGSLLISCKKETIEIKAPATEILNIYDILKTQMRKTFMLIPIDFTDSPAEAMKVPEKGDRDEMPKVATNLPDLDKCVLITEEEEHL